VGVVAGFRFVLDVRGRDRDATGLFFRRLVDGVVGVEFTTETLGTDLGQRGGQRGLAMVDVADGADVDVRLGTFELTLGHGGFISVTGWLWRFEQDGAHERNRTFDLLLTKEVLYRLSYVSELCIMPCFQFRSMERETGIEPAPSAWKAEVLPLNYSRTGNTRIT